MLRLCHPDHRFANILQRPHGRLGLLDWEHAGLRDPARDLADLITHANQEDLLRWEDWQPFLRPYLAGRTHDDPTLADRMQLYLGLYPLNWLAIFAGKFGVTQAQNGSLQEWMVNGMRPNERFRRFLARSLAWPAQDFTEALASLSTIEFFPSHE